MVTELWQDTRVGSEAYRLMNLDHPIVETRVLADMAAGIDVYYDRRWEATAVLCTWLLENLDQVMGKRVLVLGAGVGAETLVLGRHCEQLWVNDLSPVALELCAEQLEQNDIRNVTTLLGRYESLDLPDVDLVVASFLIYNKDTAAAMRAFLAERRCRMLLVNELLKPFRAFLKEESHEVIFRRDDGAVGVVLTRDVEF